MKAIVYYEYGASDVLKLEDVEKPAPKDNEVLIRVCAASVNPYDWHFMRGEPYLLRLMAGVGKPKDRRMGADVAGIAEAVGRTVTEFRAGDEVFGWCRGAFAEYACVPESALVNKPENVTFEAAAAVPIAGFTALQGLRDRGQIQPGQKVLVNGAAGGVGTFAVQFAKSFGTEVTGVCSTRNLEMVRSIGAERTIDYTRDDFTRNGEHYDLILDAVGNRSLSEMRRVLTPTGTYSVVGGSTDNWMIRPLWHGLKRMVISRFVKQRLVMCFTKGKKEDLKLISELMSSGKVKPVIDRRYRLSETAEAVRYLEQGHARGKVVIVVRASECNEKSETSAANTKRARHPVLVDGESAAGVTPGSRLTPLGLTKVAPLTSNLQGSGAGLVDHFVPDAFAF